MDIYHYSKTINKERIARDIRNVLDVISGVPKDFRERPSKSNISVFDNIIFSELTGLGLDDIDDCLDMSCSIDGGKHIVVVTENTDLADIVKSKSYDQFNEVGQKDVTYTLSVIDKAFLNLDNMKTADLVEQYTYKMIYSLVSKYQEVAKVIDYMHRRDGVLFTTCHKDVPDFYAFMYTILQAIVPLKMDDYPNASYCRCESILGPKTDELAFKFVLNGAKSEDYAQFILDCYSS